MAGIVDGIAPLLHFPFLHDFYSYFQLLTSKYAHPQFQSQKLEETDFMNPTLINRSNVPLSRNIVAETV